MIELKNLSIAFDSNKLLDKVSTEFSPHSLTAVIGRNGSGKSTLLKAISGLNRQYEGDIFIDQENLKSISRGSLAKKISFVNTQRPRISNLRCKDVVSLGRTPYTGWDGRINKKDQEIIEKAIEIIGMKEYSDRYFNSLSDGESQKIMIARAIAQDTPIMILDEPTSFLDLPTRYELAKLLKKLSTEEGKTILFSTHELDIALKFADNIALVDDKKIINLPSQKMQESHYLSQAFPER